MKLNWTYLFKILMVGVFLGGIPPEGLCADSRNSDREILNKLDQLERSLKDVRKMVVNKKSSKNGKESSSPSGTGEENLAQVAQGYVLSITRIIENTSQQIRLGASKSWNDIVSTLESVDELPGLIPPFLEQMETPEYQIFFGNLLLKIFGTFIVSGLIFWWIRKTLVASVLQNPPKFLVYPKSVAAFNTLIRLVPPFVFSLINVFMFSYLEENETARLVMYNLSYGYLFVACLLKGAKLILGTLLTLSVPVYRSLYRWFKFLILWTIIGFFSIEIAGTLGITPEGKMAFQAFYGLVIVAVLTVFLYVYRQAFGDYLRQEATKESLKSYHIHHVFNHIAPVWHLIVLFLVAFTYITWLTQSGSEIQILLGKLVLSYMFFGTSRYLDDHVVKIRGFLTVQIQKFSSNIGAALDEHFTSFELFLRFSFYGAAFLGISKLWDISWFDWMGTPDGERFVQKVTTVALTLITASLILKLANHLCSRYLTDQQQNVRRSKSVNARFKTIASLVRGTLRVLVWIPTLLLVLAELEVDITPVLGGFALLFAGLGFGAQNLVKDILTGISIIIENTVSVGDTVSIDGKTGDVEAMNLRSMRIRDDDGTVHTIPFSVIGSISNLTRDYAFAMISIGVSYKASLDDIYDALREVGTDIRQDPDWMKATLAPLEIRGVDKLEDSHMSIIFRMKTQAGKQASIRRELRRRVKLKFDEKKIQMSDPQEIRLSEGRGRK